MRKKLRLKQKYGFFIKKRTCISFSLESIDFTLKSKTYKKYFLQLQGTAMVTVFAPTYANLSMAYHEIRLYVIKVLKQITT